MNRILKISKRVRFNARLLHDRKLPSVKLATTTPPKIGTKSPIKEGNMRDDGFLHGVHQEEEKTSSKDESKGLWKKLMKDKKRV